ncbi:hypothetical protein JTB14_020665 [Gonioctena quinquepunctata]|nr:hypothetical protein JTB14_020665 [Gonioctena quinquepunctata]
MEVFPLFFPVFSLLLWHCIQVSCEAFEDKRETITDMLEESRKKQSQDIMSKIIPILVTPFMMQTMIMPVVMMFMKFALLNSIFIGKLGVVLWIVNIIRNRVEPQGELYSHNVNVHHNDHAAHQYHHHSEHSGGGYSYRRRKRS